MMFNFNAAEVFKVALAIEENGKSFYDRCQKVVDNTEIKALFSDLSREEVEHKKKFESMIAQLPKEASSPVIWDPDNELDQYIKMLADQHVFVSSDSLNSRVALVKDTKDALKLAIEFEKDSILFFLSLQEATEGKKGQELIGAIVKEEQEHLRRLSMQLFRLDRK